MMRLFVAVELDPAVRAAAREVADDLRRRIGDRLKARWVPPENMHLTVRFIGHVEDARVPEVLDALQPPLAIAPFDLELGECGVFPSSGPPRVFWIGLASGFPALQTMHEEFNRRLQPLGFTPEHRPFSAHLTLARIKDAPRGSGSVARDAVRAVQSPRARCQVTHAAVFRSVLSPHGSRYERLLDVACEP
jgi:2'-5' RNA ligase